MSTLAQLARRVARHIGRRGAFLLFLALLDAIVAYSLTQPLPLGLPRSTLYKPFVDLAPFSVWVWAWALGAVLTLVAGFVHVVRPPVFGVAALIKVAWALGYLDGWLGWERHDLAYALYARGYQTAAIFGSFGLVTLLIAGWRENDQ